MDNRSVLDSGGLSRLQLLQRSASAVCFAGGLGLLAGCSGDSSSSSSGTPTRGARGGTLRIGTTSGTPHDTLEPLTQNSVVEYMVCGAMFDPIVALDQKWAVQPAIVESWSTSKDSMKWKLRVREGVEFHDGTPLTAADVVYSIRRNLVPESGSPLFGQIGAYLEQSNVRAVDDTTVELTLNRPDALLLQSLAIRNAFVVKEDAQEQDFLSKPIGTGPFAFESFSPGRSFAGVRNDGYWQDGAPLLDRLELQTIPDAATLLSTLQSGGVDFVDSIAYPQIPQVEASPELQLLKSPGFAAVSMICDLTSPEFRDPRVVRALKLSLDRQQLVTSAFTGAGGIGYDTFVHPDDPVFNTSLPEPVRDVEQAKSLLRQAGFSNGIEVTLWCANVIGSLVDFSTAAAQQMGDAGIRVKVQQTPLSAFFATAFKKKQFYTNAFYAQSPIRLLSLTEHSEGGWNGSHFKNAAYDQALADARQSSDRAKQAEAFARAQKIQAEEGGSVVAAWVDWVGAAKSSFGGFEADYSTVIDFRRASIA